jgi:uncharacterized protein (TIGR01777 family)
MTIVITGGAGFIGTYLSKRLVNSGYTVVIVDILSPSFTHEQLFFIKCDIESSPLPYGIIEKADVVINLVGKNIYGKWTNEFKKDIEHSRIESTKNIIEAIKKAENKPSCFICASAIGFYGDTGTDIVDEKSPKGEGFLSDVVIKWENIASKAGDLGVRFVCVRTAPVIGPEGMLSKIIKTAKFGFLLKLKKQDFWMSWIHIEDIISTYVFAIETTTVQGVFNACAPEQVTHSIFMKTLGKKIKRRVIGSIPRFVTKKVFGEFFEEITKNQKVAPRRLLDKGFVFSYPTIDGALNQVFKK